MAARSCESCKQWMYDDRGEEMGSEQIKDKLGNPVKRPKITPTPCWKCPKIPKGIEPKPENAVELSGKNELAYWYYRQCLVDSTGILPRDRLVIQNNALIRLVEDAQAERQAVLTMIGSKYAR